MGVDMVISNKLLWLPAQRCCRLILLHTWRGLTNLVHDSSCHPRHSISSFRSNFLVFLAFISSDIPVVLIWPSQPTPVPTNMIPSARETRPSPKPPSRAPFVIYLTPLFFTISANSFLVSCSIVSYYCCSTAVFIRPYPGSHKHLSPGA